MHKSPAKRFGNFSQCGWGRWVFVGFGAISPQHDQTWVPPVHGLMRCLCWTVSHRLFPFLLYSLTILISILTISNIFCQCEERLSCTLSSRMRQASGASGISCWTRYHNSRAVKGAAAATRARTCPVLIWSTVVLTALTEELPMYPNHLNRRQYYTHIAITAIA